MRRFNKDLPSTLWVPHFPLSASPNNKSPYQLCPYQVKYQIETKPHLGVSPSLKPTNYRCGTVCPSNCLGFPRPGWTCIVSSFPSRMPCHFPAVPVCDWASLFLHKLLAHPVWLFLLHLPNLSGPLSICSHWLPSQFWTSFLFDEPWACPHCHLDDPLICPNTSGACL